MPDVSIAIKVTGTVDRGTWAALQAQSCPHCSKEE